MCKGWHANTFSNITKCEPIEVWIDSEVDILFLELSKVIDRNTNIKETSEYPKNIQVLIGVFGLVLALNDDSPLLYISNIHKNEKSFETEVKKIYNFLQEISPLMKVQKLDAKFVIHLVKEHKKYIIKNMYVRIII